MQVAPRPELLALPVGGIHRAASARDLVAEAKSRFEAEGISIGAYHSVIFDNWAADNHPEWRVVPATREAGYDWTVLGHRYGTLCPNHRGYREYEERRESRHCWIATTSTCCGSTWPSGRRCACATRARRATARSSGVPHPARHRLVQRGVDQVPVRPRRVARRVRGRAGSGGRVRPARPRRDPQSHRPLRDWSRGQRAEDAAVDDFAAGDLYGGFDEQVFVIALMRGLRPGVLTEFMTTRTSDLFTHTSTKTEHEMTTQVLIAVAADSAFLFIDAVEPSGRLNQGVYQRIGSAFAAALPFEGELGGEEITDVAVYYSDDSRIDEADDGSPVGAVHAGGSRHQDAVMGAVRVLRRAGASRSLW